MVCLGVLVTLASCFIGSGWTETKTLFGVEYDVVDDMLFRKDSERNLIGNEKSFVDGMKYPIVDGYPTAYYTFDPNRIVIRNLTREVLNFIEAITCFKFIEVSPEDSRSKLWYYDGGSCASGIGYNTATRHPVSIAPGCDNFEIISHETMHALGFPHTQCRPDRDENIQVLFQNIAPHNAFQWYLMPESKTYGTIYDFSSIMHYLNYFSSNTSGPSFYTNDPSHEKYISTGTTMRYSEAFMLNTYYSCFDLMGRNCTDLSCQNGGFKLDSCKCLCPDNFTGPSCETFNGPWFKPDANDRVVNEPGVFLTFGYPFENPKMGAMIWFKLPRCYYPRLKFLEKDIQSEFYDYFAVRVDLVKERLATNLYNIPVGTIFNGTGNDAIVHRINRHVIPGRGAAVAMDYIPDGSCEEAYTNFSNIVCTKVLLSNGDWTFETPKYPEITDNGMACALPEEIAENKLMPYLVTLTHNITAGERFEMTHEHDKIIKMVSPTSGSVSFVSSYPMNILYKASKDSPGSFSIKASLINCIPTICGTTTNVNNTLSVTQPFTRSFKPTFYPSGVICNMLFKAPAGSKLKLTLQLPTLKSGESFVVYKDYKNKSERPNVINQQSDPITSSSDAMLVAYRFIGTPSFSNWQFAVTPV